MTGRLIDQQRAMQGAITAGGAAVALLRDLPGREPLLRIYQHAYAVRLVGALRDNFGVLPRVMGDDAFEALAHDYVAEHPSRHPSIRWYGDGLPAFMATHDDLVPHPALVDLARMEWALRQAFDAADATPIDATALAGIPSDAWALLRFAAVPSLQLVDLSWAVEPVWKAMQSVDAGTGEEPDLPEPLQHSHLLLIWRQGLENRWRSLDALQANLLQVMAAGETFSALCECAAAHVGADDAALTTVTALQTWLADGLLRAVVGRG